MTQEIRNVRAAALPATANRSLAPLLVPSGKKRTPCSTSPPVSRAVVNISVTAGSR
ncbi:Hypothetical protein MexAM1_META2p0284 (plasmid) [Methylorubrum extorquens AM1]|uniref:Uncharacterized protein n=1 Tax=Methylorubrum extorquens (strain ATCC 14718 / DSM 1338 / JCM 2805 / NCIMB 9133 / AM1) TaxID=272630 RepID=C5B3Y3_METEA|nr:Hypothetical protein MexAM1_META2p0284 [Methylorubrum extorquens AM1]